MIPSCFRVFISNKYSINSLSKQFIGGTQRDLSHQLNPLWDKPSSDKKGKIGTSPFDGINLTTYNPQPNKIEKEQSATSKTRRGINEAKVGFPSSSNTSTE